MTATELLRQLCSGTVETGLLEQLERMPTSETSLLLARCTITPAIPLHVRLLLLRWLARRPAWAPLALRLVRSAPADEVRALAAQLLADHTAVLPLEPFCAAATDPAFPLARRAAVAALARHGHSNADMLLYTLLPLLAEDDIELVEQTAATLGALGDQRVIPALAGLLPPTGVERLRRVWATSSALLTRQSPEDWPTADLPPTRTLLIATLLAEGETAADRPGNFAELLSVLATRYAHAGARALAMVGGESAQRALYDALLATPTDPAAPELLHCLARIDRDGTLLRALLRQPDLDPMLRCRVVETIVNQENGRAVERESSRPFTGETQRLGTTALFELLDMIHDDPFARGALAQALQHVEPLVALPLLRNLATSSAEPDYVRRQAIAALSSHGGLTAEATLLPLVTDGAAPLLVRRDAAAGLPASISPEACATLREMLRRERLPWPLCAALLAALGRAKDQEALPILLQFCQNDRPDVAHAALDALAAIGDVGVISRVVTLSQMPNAERALRLHAVGVLLQLSGEEFLPLLRPYLAHGSVSLQLQALGYLQRALPQSPLLPALLQDHGAPLPLRQAVALALPADTESGRLLCELLRCTYEAPPLRMLSADRLGSEHWPEPIPAEASAALFLATTADSALVRRRSISALANLGTADAGRALSGIVADHTQPSELRAWAATGLVGRWVALAA